MTELMRIHAGTAKVVGDLVHESDRVASLRKEQVGRGETVMQQRPQLDSLRPPRQPARFDFAVASQLFYQVRQGTETIVQQIETGILLLPSLLVSQQVRRRPRCREWLSKIVDDGCHEAALLFRRAPQPVIGLEK